MSNSTSSSTSSFSVYGTVDLANLGGRGDLRVGPRGSFYARTLKLHSDNAGVRLDGGRLTVGTLDMSGVSASRFDWTAGELAFADSHVYLGGATAATNTLSTNSLTLATGKTLSLTGSAKHLYVGYDRGGLLTQTGGAVTLPYGNNLYLGAVSSGGGSYALSGGTATIGQGLIIGNESGTTGLLLANGGTISCRLERKFRADPLIRGIPAHRNFSKLHRRGAR